ncbi:hypothetical protein K505DRAFT_335782 [Melanomma pulvis-pyrius CBS 109.77]|uniref:Uncharacterized protein n=1 Tax=Melanomma pulvis-pyrius CBS 109.77 TaxID=1314802 RepID=A0A6A6XI49_9PLEO|nr:hypothetical protein K505DRAFT_335782 [Melanomma pulvis-pyrius CBS 109.77]
MQRHLHAPLPLLSLLQPPSPSTPYIACAYVGWYEGGLAASAKRNKQFMPFATKLRHVAGRHSRRPWVAWELFPRREAASAGRLVSIDFALATVSRTGVSVCPVLYGHLLASQTTIDATPPS